MKVTIVGAGMTGLLAAKACMDVGILPHIIAKDLPTKPKGIRYLHDSCRLPLTPLSIRTSFVDSVGRIKQWCEVDKKAMAELYAYKTGASMENNSVHRSEELVLAYSWDAAMVMLHGFKIDFAEVTGDDISVLSKENDLLIVTVPLPHLFREYAKSCKYRALWVTDSVPMASLACTDDDVCVYNVDPEQQWTRFSRVRSREQTEWLNYQEDGQVVIKVKSIDSKKLPKFDNTMFVGRYAEWNSERMAHEAYGMTLSKLKKTLTSN